MSLATTMRIMALKAEARRIYLSLGRQYDEFSCGANLAEFIRPSLGKQRERFNEIMRELAKIDPEAKAVVEKEGLI